MSTDTDRALAVLTTAGDALARGTDLDGTIGRILEAAVAAVGASRAAVLLQDPDRPDLELAGAVGMDDTAIAGARDAVARGEGAAAGVARTRTADLSIGGEAHLPLSVSRGGIERAVGVVSFGWDVGRSIEDDERAMLVAVADLLAVAVDRAQVSSLVVERSEWFERMAHSDPLTGLANDRTFGRILELEIARASRQGSEVSLALFDVDDFGTTNAEAGSQAGDDVLRKVAARLAESVRLVDTVARWGGDEFVLVAPGAAGATVARRVIEGVASLPAVDGRPISVSAGVAHFPTDGADAAELLAAAEAALDRARTEGRGGLGEASSSGVGSEG